MQRLPAFLFRAVGPPAWLPGGFLVLAGLLLGAAPGRSAPLGRPWMPPFADSLTIWASEAKVRFQTNRGDSASGENFRPYERVGRIGRRLIRSLGPEGARQVRLIEPVLDSLGLDTEVHDDPEQPGFTLLLVRNPYRLTANAVAFLYWTTGDDLRMQGVVLRGGFAPRMRVWWTGKSAGPYEWGILDQERDPEGRLGLVLLRLLPNGMYWSIVQYESEHGDLGRAGDAFWVDINGDRQPEVVSWSRAAPDSAFEECAGCPHLYNERILSRRESGFELQDSRLLPSPYTTFVLFIRLLREGNRAAASRLLADPERVQEATALGWAQAGRGAWRMEYAEPDQPWPRWLAMRDTRAVGRPVYIVRFTMKDARWIIADWEVARVRGGTEVDLREPGR